MGRFGAVEIMIFFAIVLALVVAIIALFVSNQRKRREQQNETLKTMLDKKSRNEAGTSTS